MTFLAFFAGFLVALLFLFLFILFYFIWSRVSGPGSFGVRAQEKRDELKRSLESERREALVKLKDELHKRRSEFTLESKRERVELERFQDRINLRCEAIDKKSQAVEEARLELCNKERSLLHLSDQLRFEEQKIRNLYDELVVRLEKVSGMSRGEAREALLKTLEVEVRHNSERLVKKIEEDYRLLAKEKASDILVAAMQRCVVEKVNLHSSSVVSLPNEEMKGRIIGKEGRNIRALEMATGVEFVISEAPEIIVVSSFNPVRREIACRTLEKLILDGRINPTRIEEAVADCEREVDDIVSEFGNKAVSKFNLQGVKPEIIDLLGKLHFRTSFSQNVLTHSIEVGLISRMLAEELGLSDPKIALRAGLLHDIGKVVSAEQEGTHASLGAEIAKCHGESNLVVNAIAAHHEEVPFSSVYSVIVMIADTVSASRPGARRETLTAYLKRLESLEEIANDFFGVKKVYALQAGREVRVIVDENILDDTKALNLARDLADKISNEMTFSGQIKVNVIRERRSIEYAR